MLDWKKNLDKLRDLPEHHRRMVLFSVVGVVAVILGSLWVTELVRSVPKIVTGLSKDVPNISLPSLPTTPSSQQEATTTYQNSQYHFSFQYPNGMQVVETSGKQSFTVQVNKDNQVAVQVVVYPSQAPQYNVMETHIPIGKTEGSVVKENQSQTNPCLGILVQQNTTSYVIDDDCLSPSYQAPSQDMTQMAQQILSTFSLTATTSPSQ
jgi:hypothetical protein